MTEPQVWTLIGVFAAALVGMITFSTQVMWRSINAQFESMRHEMRSEFSTIRAEAAAQFDSVHSQLTHLDRDVQAISRRVFPE